MSKKKIGRVLSRTLKKDFGSRKNPYPKKLKFLSQIPFYAVTKCRLPDANKRQVRIEILPNSLKKILKSQRVLSDVEEEKNQLIIKLDEAENEIGGLTRSLADLQRNYDQLMKNIEEGDDNVELNSGYKTNLQVAKEKGIKLHGRPLQGGLPGLGKKR